jgi:2-C-methyl-D-erythritol 4-phosphate cytidylyltransferase / 2-C-methyl-D-erythritol 2,4-cyclodiphosphate synthase
MDTPKFIAIILAAGRGERAGLLQPKQWAMLGPRPVALWSLAAFAAHHACAAIVLVTADGLPPAAMELPPRTRVVAGGASRQESVAAALRACEEIDAPLIAIHDAARPGLDAAMIDALLAATQADHNAGAVPVLPVADTLVWAQDGAEIGDVVDRAALARVQTPQMFRRDWIIRAHAKFAQRDDFTDDAQLVRAVGGVVCGVPGTSRLDKITRKDDLQRMAAILAPALPTRTAVGMGYDVHRLVPGDGVWLCGVKIPSALALLGHSDADVGLHALTDALLGSIGAGDIGMHFSPDDPRWAGAASDQFLTHAADLVRAAGGRIDHVDVTIICEAPKVGPHRETMRARVADITGLPLLQVSIKATTSERLGFTGRGEGISAQAVATVSFQDILE